MKKDLAPATSANEVLDNIRDDHNWRLDPVDLTTTGGLQRAITAPWHALRALADYVDGVATGKTDSELRPIRNTEPVKTPVKTVAPGTAPFVSHPVADPYPSAPAPVI